jgi:subtilisin family serine protease
MMIKFSAVLLGAIVCHSMAFAQPNVKKETVPNGWHLMDQSTTGYYGISLDKAYEFLKEKNIKSKTITVAVIDGGIDTTQEDLKAILWRNPKEIPGNGIDDDHNGYIDDVYGWNFLGGKDGRNVKEDSFEAARVYYALKSKYEGKDGSGLTGDAKAEYEMYVRARTIVTGDVDEREVYAMKQMLPRFIIGDSVIQKELGKAEYNGNDLKNYSPKTMEGIFVKSMMIGISKANDSYDITNAQLIGEMNGELRKAEAANTPPPAFRKDIVKDDETNINDRFYGNNDVMTGTPFHGTHCAGIIGAIRNNNKGVDGVADNVRIMMVRAVPDGDEHDKDVANAIRYAVDNGARIISMSFGKDFSPNKKWVDDAFRYAESKGVLLVKAAGNDNKNVDVEPSYPNPVYADGKGRATNVINVGASGDPKNGGLAAKFSNYGKNEVDIFAPGVGIYSTIPGVSNYGNANGTSMACPVVAGVAALLLEHFPTLTPQQLKQAIEKSAQVPQDRVLQPGTKDMVEFSELARTAGIINAYEAVKYASSLVKAPVKKTVLPKPTFKKAKAA